MFQTKVVEKIKTHILSSGTFFFGKNCAVFAIMWEKNTVERASPQMAIWRIAYWVTKATYTHSEYVIVTAFPLQQWLHEHSSLLRLYVNWLSC